MPMGTDLKDLITRENFWDLVAIWLAAAVALGVAVEAICESDTVVKWLGSDTDKKGKIRHRIAKCGLLLLVLALSFEVVVGIMTHRISEQIWVDFNDALDRYEYALDQPRKDVVTESLISTLAPDRLSEVLPELEMGWCPVPDSILVDQAPISGGAPAPRLLAQVWTFVQLRFGLFQDRMQNCVLQSTYTDTKNLGK
jgi:hypothetical protein